MFANLGDQAWTEEGPVAGSAHVAILVGRREEASRIMDEYFRRNPHVPLSDYRLRVLGELARPTLEPVTTLPQGEPTISHLLWPKESP